MDLLSQDLYRVGGIARPDIVVVEERYLATAWKTAFAKSSKTLSEIQQSDLKLWTF